MAHAFFLSAYGIDTPLPKIISLKGDVPRDLSKLQTVRSATKLSETYK